MNVTINYADDTSEDVEVTKFPWTWRSFLVYQVPGSPNLTYVPSRNVSNIECVDRPADHGHH